MLERDRERGKESEKERERVLLVAYVDNNVYAKGISRLMFPMKYYRERGERGWKIERETERGQQCYINNLIRAKYISGQVVQSRAKK